MCFVLVRVLTVYKQIVLWEVPEDIWSEERLRSEAGGRSGVSRLFERQCVMTFSCKSLRRDSRWTAAPTDTARYRLSEERSSPTGPWMHRSSSFSPFSDVWSCDVTCSRLWTWICMSDFSTHTPPPPCWTPPLFVPTVWSVVRRDLRLQCFPRCDLWATMINSDSFTSVSLLCFIPNNTNQAFIIMFCFCLRLFQHCYWLTKLLLCCGTLLHYYYCSDVPVLMSVHIHISGFTTKCNFLFLFRGKKVKLKYMQYYSMFQHEGKIQFWMKSKYFFLKLQCYGKKVI